MICLILTIFILTLSLLFLIFLVVEEYGMRVTSEQEVERLEKLIETHAKHSGLTTELYTETETEFKLPELGSYIRRCITFHEEVNNNEI